MASSLELVLNGTNATYIAEVYVRYLENSNSVDPSWGSVFEGLDDENRTVLDELEGASWAPSRNKIIGNTGDKGDVSTTGNALKNLDSDSARKATIDSLNLRLMIQGTML